MRFEDRNGVKQTIIHTDQLAADIRALLTKYECAHVDARLSRRVVRGGGIQIVKQCQRCGASVGGAVKRTKAHDELPAFSDALRDRYESQFHIEHRALLTYHFERQQAERDERQRAYQEYLRSAGWAEKRKKAIMRAGGVCEGCGESPATEVHHLSYGNRGKEFLFELIAVCGPCHRRLHPSASSVEVDAYPSPQPSPARGEGAASGGARNTL